MVNSVKDDGSRVFIQINGLNLLHKIMMNQETKVKIAFILAETKVKTKVKIAFILAEVAIIDRFNDH